MVVAVVFAFSRVLFSPRGVFLYTTAALSTLSTIHFDGIGWYGVKNFWSFSSYDRQCVGSQIGTVISAIESMHRVAKAMVTILHKVVVVSILGLYLSWYASGLLAQHSKYCWFSKVGLGGICWNLWSGSLEMCRYVYWGTRKCPCYLFQIAYSESDAIKMTLC